MNTNHSILFIVAVPIFSIYLFSKSVSATESIERAGDILQIALPLTAWGVSHFSGDDDGFYQFTKSFAITLAATQALKIGLDETRPNGGNYSFPSGHTSAAFSAASFLQKRYGMKYGIPAYIAASFVGYSRIEANAHYPRDVIAGALLAITVNHYVVTTPNKTQLALNFSPGKESISLILSTSW